VVDGVSGSFAGKVFIITGASRGVGFGTARILAERGARVALFARDPAAVTAAAASIGDGALGITVDVGDREGMFAAFEQTVQAFGRLDGVVNNAGATMVCRVEYLTEAVIMKQIRANFLGVVYGSQAAIAHMRKNDGGRIINVTSARARHPEEFPYLSIYAATKLAAERFSFDLREEVKADNIGVTVFSPGGIDTSFGDALSQEEAEAGLQKWLEAGPHSDGRLAVATVAEAIVNCLALPDGCAYDFVELRPNRPTVKTLYI